MKLLIAIPSLDYMHATFVQSLQALTKKLYKDGINFDVMIETGTLVYAARDKLSRYAMERDYTHVLWLDSDMVFSESLLDDLMFSGKNFVTGLACSRRPPYVSCVFKDLISFERYEEFPSDTFKVAGCGFACVLISVDILREVWASFSTCFCPEKSLGEDLAFCKRARFCNYEIWAEPGARLGHIGHVPVYPGEHEKYMAGLGAEK